MRALRRLLDVGYWHLADMVIAFSDVRYWPKADMAIALTDVRFRG